jgi:hypothetical protein
MIQQMPREHFITSALPSPGEEMLVTHRRRLDKEVSRHFVGEAASYEQGMAPLNKTHNTRTRPEDTHENQPATPEPPFA